MASVRKPRPDLSARNQMSAKHGMLETPTYRSWKSMNARCNCQSNKDFHKYGGRGISVCDRWKDFKSFYEDMGDRPDGMTIDRIDVNGNYEPSNCRWASPKTQGRNTRSNVIIEFNGKAQCIADWAEEVGIERKTLEYRMRSGWEASRALTTPSLIKRK